MTTLKKLEELIYKGFKETDDRLAQHRKEIDESIKKHRKESDERAEKLRKESDERIEKHRKESDERIERIHQKLAKELGGVTESLSRFSEQGVLAAVKRLFDERGIALNHLFQNLTGHLNGDNMETDVIGVGPGHAILIEVKLRLRQNDVREFLDKKLPRFFKFFPNLHRPILYGGVAGMSIDEGAERYAYNQGLFVIAQSGENLLILNDEEFKPRSFAAAKSNHLPKRKTK